MPGFDAFLTTVTFLLLMGAGALTVSNEGDRYIRTTGATAAGTMGTSLVLFVFMFDGVFFFQAENPFMHAIGRYASLGLCILGAYGAASAYVLRLPLVRRLEAGALFMGSVCVMAGIYQSLDGWSWIGGTVLFFIWTATTSGIAAGAIVLGLMSRWPTTASA